MPEDSLAESRARFVRRYRANRASWPDGIGAWYRPQDWASGNDDTGDILIATGEARVRALDPWANMRAKGERCPPLPGVKQSGVKQSGVKQPDVKQPKAPDVKQPDRAAYLRQYMREYQRKRRAAQQQS
jgi:hypothetical protein